MRRSLRWLGLVLAGGTAILSGLAVLLAGLWALPAEAPARQVLAVGLQVFVIAVVCACVLGWLIGRSLGKSVENMRQAIEDFGAGRLDTDPRVGLSLELQRCAQALRELGSVLQERQRVQERSAKSAARACREDALLRLGNGVLADLHRSLSSVSGFVDLAQRQPAVDGNLKNYLVLLEQEARGARETVDRLARLVRLEALPVERVDLNAVVREVIAEFASTLEGDSILLRFNPAPDLVACLAERPHLKDVVCTLIDNAREALLPGGGTLDVGTSMTATGKLLLTVRDSGRGIPPALQDQVFTPFFSSKPGRKGAGIGLAIAHRSLRLMSGSIEFISAANEGTLFTVTLEPFDEPPLR